MPKYLERNFLRATLQVLLVAFFACVSGTGESAFGQDQNSRVMTGVRFHGDTTLISMVIPGGPAEKIGLQVGDEILSIGDDYMLQPTDVVIALDGKKPNDVIRLEVRRGSESFFANLKLISFVRGDVIVDPNKMTAVAAPKLGITDEMAPELTVKLWRNLPEGESPRLARQRGKVVCLLFFQNDCEFSKRKGLPQFKEIVDEFSGDDKVVTWAIQTPFRNHDENNLSRADEIFKELNLDCPLGHDGSLRIRSATYADYKAPGTPWVVVIDTKGVVHYNNSRLPIDEAKEMIAKLKKVDE